MLPIRLEIKNFLAYRSPEPVQFDGIHLACLTGANGAGKSSLLDAITWALWGKARARRDEELVHLGQNDMYVLLEFEQDGLIYQVIRRRSRTKSGSGTLDLIALGDDGTPNDISEPNMRATQDKINRLLNLDYETFVHSAFLQQGKADAFTTKTPRERKQILSDILGLARWETYEEATKEILKEIDTEIQMRQMQIEEIERDIEQEPALIAAVAEAEQQQQDAEAALHEAEAALKQVEHAPGEMRNAQRRQAEAEQRLRHLDGDLKAADAEIARQERKVASYEAIISARDEIEAGYAALEDARSTNEALGDKLMALSEIDEQRRAFERQLDAARAELEKEVNGYEVEVTALEKTIDAALPDALEEIRLEIAELELLEDERGRLDDELTALKNETSSLEGTNSALRPEMTQLKERIDRLKAASGAFCPLCGQPLTEEHRVSLLAELQAQGEERGNAFRTNQARIAEINGEIKTMQGAVTDVRVRLQRLADLKGRAGQLRAGVDAAHDAELQLHAVHARLDAARATLDGGEFASDLRAQITALDARRSALGYDSDLHSAARQSLETLREFETRQNELRIALEALPDAQMALEGAAARRERLLVTQAEEREQLAAASGRNRAAGNSGARGTGAARGSQSPAHRRAGGVPQAGGRAAGAQGN
ncbi:MAG: SMC family ATPase [Anaerolineae bacterium]